jgi:hypothetical protein
MNYRPFSYYFFWSFFIIALLFSSLESYSSLSFKKSLKSFPQSSFKKDEYQLVELVSSSSKNIKNPFFFSNKEHGGQNKSYDTYTNSLSGLTENENNFSHKGSNDKSKQIKNFRNLEKEGNLKLLEKKTDQLESGASSAGRKIHIEMDDKGDFSINTTKLKGAQYLIDTAKGILNYWVQFIPASMVYNGFLKDNNQGEITGILVFQKHNRTYSMSIAKPFESGTINSLTSNAFRYYDFPTSDEINLQTITVELKIQRNTLRIAAKFEFELK